MSDKVVASVYNQEDNLYDTWFKAASQDVSIVPNTATWRRTPSKQTTNNATNFPQPTRDDEEKEDIEYAEWAKHAVQKTDYSTDYSSAGWRRVKPK